MQLFNKYRWYILGAFVFIIVCVVMYNTAPKRPVGPPPDVTTLQSGNFSFTYARVYQAKEYSPGQVSLGGTSGKMFIPLVDIVRYKPDPQSAKPVSFAAFVSKQVQALCGTDGSVESVTCTNPVVTPYTASTTGAKAEEVMLTLTRKNLSTGAVKTLPYGPIFVFDTSLPATATDPASYQGVFVYPNFTSFLLVGTTSPAFIESIAATVVTGK